MSKGTNAYGPKNIWVPKSQTVPYVDIRGRKRSRFKLGTWTVDAHDTRWGKALCPST